MGDRINKEFEEYQRQLEIHSRKLKDIVKFVPNEKLDELMKELKDKKVTL